MAAQLDIDGTYDSRGYFVAWYENGEEGAWVGQEGRRPDKELAAELKAAKDSNDFETFEFYSVEIAAKAWRLKSPDEFGRDDGGYVLGTHAAAEKFLRAMRAVVKAARAEYKSGVAWPDWALKASAAGWKPPKGWKP